MNQYVDPGVELERAELVEEVLKLRVQGLTGVRIQEQLDITPDLYHKIIARAATETLARSSDLVDEMFLIHYRRLEDLYQKTMAAIDASPFFDNMLIKTAISVLERQSRLLGLDRDRGITRDGRPGKHGESTDRYSWMTTATPAEILKEAEALGIRVPAKFRLLPDSPFVAGSK